MDGAHPAAEKFGCRIISVPIRRPSPSDWRKRISPMVARPRIDAPATPERVLMAVERLRP
ncbi:hypothetical protein VB636_00670 [Paracoccus sp. APAP_BH8]|uniref:hypothetical protein n=1 Tax=Paracoccus sp. APAP_BH8 TaxID=3110237 RepID=UPI002FD7C87A